MTAPEVLNREFLEIREKLLQLAAALDRMDRAGGDLPSDGRIDKIHRALEVLQGDKADRAETIQLIFSRNYEKDWRNSFGLATPG